MKYLIIFLLLISCSSKTVQVNVAIQSDFKVTRQGVFELTASIVPDFDHVYDSIDFVATNNSTNKQVVLKGSKPEFDFAASPGNYNIYMGTASVRRIERYVHFSASNPSVDISSTNKKISLTSDTQQGLLLIVKSGVETIPVIKVGTMQRQMYETSKYYYAYVYDDGKGAQISTTISGVVLNNIVIGVSKGVVYVFNPLGVNIKLNDPFSTVKEL